MKPKHLLLLFFYLGSISLSKAQDLESYLQIALVNNPELKAQHKAFEAAMQKAAQISLPNPQLSMGYFVSPVETRVGPQRLRFSLSQMFPWFGALKAQEKTVTLKAEAKYQGYLQAKNQLMYQVGMAYYPLYELEEVIQIETENLELLKSYKAIATKKVANGKGNTTDVLRTEIMMQEAENMLDILAQKRQALHAKFNSLLHRNYKEAVILPDSLAINDFINDYQRDSLLSSQPLLTALDLQIAASKANEIAIEKSGMPSFGLGLDYVLVSKREGVAMPDNGKNILMPMATISIPIFRKKYVAAQQENQLMQESYALQKDAVGDRLKGTYEMSLFQARQQQRLFKLYEKQTITTQQTLDLLMASYANTGQNFEEVLRMQQQLLQYKKMQATAVAAFYQAIAALDLVTAKY